MSSPSLGIVSFRLQLIDAPPGLCNFISSLLFVLICDLERRQLVLNIRNRFTSKCEPFFTRLVLLAFERVDLNLQL